MHSLTEKTVEELAEPAMRMEALNLTQTTEKYRRNIVTAIESAYMATEA